MKPERKMLGRTKLEPFMTDRLVDISIEEAVSGGFAVTAGGHIIAVFTDAKELRSWLDDLLSSGRHK